MQAVWTRPESAWDCRIIFSDIDGTLLTPDNRIPVKTRDKILKLEQRGIRFILVSARTPDGVRVVQNELGIKSTMVCYSGGLILDEGGRPLFSRQMPLEQAVEIKTLLEQDYPDICCNSYGMNRWVVDDDRNPWVMQEAAITGGKAAVGDIGTLFSEDGGIHKFLLMGEPEVINGAAQLLRKRYPKLTIQRSKDTYLEVMGENVKKSVGVNFLCQYYGISNEQAAAFGDGENDLDMLGAVGYGFAMANAPEAVKEQARYVTLSNEEEGIWHVIRDL